MTDKEKAAALARIKTIDEGFEAAKAWGSWMIESSNEREGLVNRLRAAGVEVEHNYLARDSSGNPVD